MSKTFCISCDLEACNHQLHFNPMLSRPYDHTLPDEWITMIKGDPQTHEARNFCSYHCLSEWVSLEKEIEHEKLLAKQKKPRNLILRLKQNRLDESKDNFDLSKLVTTRSSVLKNVFATQFFTDEELDLTISHSDSLSWWEYTLCSANDEHIEWAERAEKSGIIDQYKVIEVNSEN